MLLAQISDIHATPGYEGLDRLAKVAEWLHGLRPDLLVITGDLVDDDWQEGYKTIGAILRTMSCPVHVIPGNSDCRDMMHQELVEFCAASQPMHFSRDLAGLTCLGLDVTVPGASHGDAAPHCDWLQRALEPGRPSVIFMHQPPIETGIVPLDAVMCRNSDAFAEVLENAGSGVLAVVCGHVHRPISGRIGRTPVYICGSLCEPNPLVLGSRSAPLLTDAPSFAVCEIDRGHFRHHTISLSVRT
jgi:3',5'-cyclic AMP phosphodiesterase CpdA